MKEYFVEVGMLKRKSILFLTILLTTFSLVVVIFKYQAESAVSSRNVLTGLSLTIRTHKKRYILGEAVEIESSVTNTELSDITILGTDQKSGTLKFYIASSDQVFKWYHYPGIRVKIASLIKAGRTVHSNSKLLFNSKPQVSHLNTDAAKSLKEGVIMTDYAFPVPGEYFIKATIFIPDGNSTIVESEAIRIIVDEPTGDDLNIWNIMRKNLEIGYFMQEAGMLLSKEEARADLLGEINQLLAANPSGKLADNLRISLDKFKVREDKRKAFLEKRKRQKPPQPRN